MPKVSVIVPVYNEEKNLKRCLDSLVNQTLKDIEIITINDGSKDSSLSILEEYQDKYNSIKIINEFHSGVGAARNIGLSIANGEYIKFVDADDYLSLDILEKMYHLAKENNVKLVRGNYQTIIGPIKTIDTCSLNNIRENTIVDVRKNKDYIVTETAGICNKLISNELLQNLKFPIKTKWDNLAIIPIVIAQSEKVYHMNEPVYNYRVNINNVIKDFTLEIPNILDIIKCVDMVEKEMQKRNLSEEYNEQIKCLYILHTLYRVENAMMWINTLKSRKEVIINSLINLLELKYPDWSDNKIIEEYKEVNFLFKYNMDRLHNYTKNYIREDNIEKVKQNVLTLFK